MGMTQAAEWYEKGIEALNHDHVYLARTCFEHAAEEERSPKNCSFLALCQAKTRGKFGDSISLAHEAVAQEPDNSVHYLNLGRIYLLAGKRREAIEVFREGMKYGKEAEIISELGKLGIRRPPPIPSLNRSHPLNKYLGIMLTRLGLR